MSALTVRSTESPLAEINITPLIDVMLALLLIFMISAPLVTKKIELPIGSSDGKVSRTVELRIAADGQVIFNDAALSPIELEAQLLSWAGQGENTPTLQLAPDKAVPHQRLIDVLALARQSGIQGISIETPRQ
ncbi:MAG TPA: biopolymer transporter ExbD [Tahibacter sp.]|uniref:ExbD/TolR family protein n=1 Tax=Tahibacter sp. TaxID=2056211 RepID=UPI002D1305B3|nr:biopolymer transporter ExbD [Tahibacter sp.]HSX60511.1 biopolymer transporter ExbD [Tahibacter sp.]